MTARVKQIIREQGYRQNFVAERIGISEQYLSNLLAERDPWPARLQERVAEVLRLPVAFLFASELSTDESETCVTESEPPDGRP